MVCALGAPPVALDARESSKRESSRVQSTSALCQIGCNDGARNKGLQGVGKSGVEGAVAAVAAS